MVPLSVRFATLAHRKIGLTRLQELRRLSDVGGDAPRLVPGHQIRRCAPAGLVLEIDVGEGVTVGVADDVAVLAELLVRVIDRPGRRETAFGQFRWSFSVSSWRTSHMCFARWPARTKLRSLFRRRDG